MADFTNQSLKFHSEAVPKNTLLVNRLSGVEMMSGLFRFSLDLISTDPKLDLEKILYQPAKVGIEERLPGGMKTFRWFHGTLESLEQAEQGQSWTTYQAVLVPDVWKLSEFYRSRVFQKRTVDQLVADVLKTDIGLQDGTDFEFKLSRADAGGGDAEREVYPEREYIVQYEETDLNLVQRWLEHEGIFFFFENDGTNEKLVFGDSVSAYKPVHRARSSSFPYRPQGRSQSTGASQGDKASPEEVLAFKVSLTRNPKKIALNDYNWRDPSVALATSADIETEGVGKQTEYNDHFKTPEQGKALAGVRAEEWTCRAAVYSGISTCRAFRPGRTFDLEQHFRDDFNRNYLLTSVTHDAEQAINLEASTVTGASYQNSFQAIPSDLDFRPDRLTEWPCIKGTMHARVDAEGDGEFSEIDEHGRYKLIFPFDEASTNADPGKASRWVRMAQPYAGANSGFHFPLLKGTEVLVTHIDGDPDRPVIAAAVPNPEAQSPVDSGNNRQNKVATTNGNLMILDDSEELQGFVFADGSGHFIQDHRQPASGGGSGGGGGGEVPWGGEAGPGGGGEAVPGRVIPDHLPEGLKKAMRGNPIAPPELARHLQQLRPGFGAGTDDDMNEAFGVSDAQTEVAAYVATGLDTAYATAGLDIVTVAEGDSPAAPVDQDHRFEVAHYDNKLRFWKGDTTTIQQGNKWTYADVTHDVSFGTGGFGYKREDGDTVDYSVQNGSATSTSEMNGDSTSDSTTIGNSDSTSMTIGDSTSMSLSIGDSTSLSLNIGDSDSASMNIGNNSSIGITFANNDSLSLTMGSDISTSLSLSISSSTSIAIGASSSTALNLAASASAAINIGASSSATINIAASADAAINIGASASAKIDLAASASATLALSASVDFELKAAAAAKLAIYAAATADIDIFAAAKFSLEVSASAILELTLASAGGKKINLGGDDTTVSIPSKTEIALTDTGLVITKGETQVNCDITSLITKIT